ncbi:penicillin-binding transpeptidase domain-containing protein [Bacteriovoracaceae bacterium]|nr:penicillin-binding transpeptidase domain-containing protein [Bacteriovoracaceae bacterium]
MKNKKKELIMIIVALTSSVVMAIVYLNILNKNREEKTKLEYYSYINQLHDIFLNSDEVKREYVLDEKIKVKTTVEEEWQVFLKKMLKRNSNFFTSVAIIDNNTGRIIGVYGNGRNKLQKANNIIFSPTHPAASLFKIVSSAELLQNQKISPDTKFSYRGRGTTLYKYQLKDKITKWSRKINFKKAFAFSNNVIFGKAAIKNSNAVELSEMAYEFGFNRDILTNLDLQLSKFRPATDQYNLAEVASGFNKKTLTTPIHAAFLSYVVASKNPVKTISIIENISKNNIIFVNPERKVISHVSKSLREDVYNLMEFTALSGTARSLTRRLRYNVKKNYSIGAKTGSITGGLPKGKREWLTFFVKPNGEDDLGISVSIMNIYKDKWYQKPTYFGKKVIKHYVKLKSEPKRLTSSGRN